MLQTVCAAPGFCRLSSRSLQRPPTVEANPLIGEKPVPCYNPGNRTRVGVICGLAFSVAFGIACIIIGSRIQSHSIPITTGTYSDGNLFLSLSPSLREVLLLLLNVTLVKLSVWSSGAAHETALKWTLAYENDRQKPGEIRLEFNANLRFLRSSYKWYSANGLPANVVMALCLAVSYAASSMVLMNVERSGGPSTTIVPSVALYALGITTLLQSGVAVWAICTTKIPTWSQSALDTAAVLLGERKLTRRPGRCMHSLYDRFESSPVRPRKRQEPAWESHPQFLTFVMYVWMLVAAGYYWTFIIWGMMASGSQGAHRGSNLNPIPESDDTGSMTFGWEGVAPTVGLLWGLGILVGFQGGIITTGMTCAQTLVALVYDEHLWREANTERGTDQNPSFLKGIFMSWQTILMTVAEPVFHWLFGLAVSLDADVGFHIYPVQILYVSIAGTVGVIIITAAGKAKPRTYQPSTYGHLQTLVDLIDEWHPKMFWGHKRDGYDNGSRYRFGAHAGTRGEFGKGIAVDPDSYYGDCKREDC